MVVDASVIIAATAAREAEREAERTERAQRREQRKPSLTRESPDFEGQTRVLYHGPYGPTYLTAARFARLLREDEASFRVTQVMRDLAALAV